MALISAVIINHNRKELLMECLASLYRQTRQPDEILLIDNASTDDSVKAASHKFPDIKIIANKINLNFCAASNEGIASAKGELVLMLNNDIRLKEDFLDRLFNAINRDEKIGIAGGKMLQFDEGHIDSAGQFLSKSKRIIDRGYRELDNIRYDIGGFTLGINASCALYRRAMLDDIRENGQYFDEDFEYFYEEMDLALRARRRGWKAYYEPTAVAYHKRGATTKGLRPTPYLLGKYYITHLTTRFQHYALRNRYLMIIKNCPITDILKDLPYILRYEITQALYIIFFKPALLLYILKDIKVFSRTFRKRNDIFSGER